MMDYKCTCKRRHLLDVVSQLNRNRVYIELHVAKSQSNNYTCNPTCTNVSECIFRKCSVLPIFTDLFRPTVTIFGQGHDVAVGPMFAGTLFFYLHKTQVHMLPSQLTIFGSQNVLGTLVFGSQNVLKNVFG